MSAEPLGSRNLARYGLRRGAYDGARRRRFVLYESCGDGNEWAHEYDTKRERDAAAMAKLAERSMTRDYFVTVNYQARAGNRNSWDGVVNAHDEDSARGKAHRIVRKTRRVAKIDSSDVESVAERVGKLMADAFKSTGENAQEIARRLLATPEAQQAFDRHLARETR